MKLTKETIQVLQNFATIQKNLVIPQGNTLSTMSEARNILASVEVGDVFPSEVCVYDLDEFLAALGLVEDFQLEFKEGYCRIFNKTTSVKYYYANKSILTYPQKEIKLPETEIEVTLTEAVISGARKASSVFGYSTLSIVAKENAVTVNVIDPENTTANSYTQDVGNATANIDCESHFLVSNLKLLPGNYKVNISSKLISRWENLDNSAVYFIALEKSSKF